MKRTVIAQQGEVKVFRIDAVPESMETRPVKRTEYGAATLSHSEKGHHHVIDAVDVMERIDNVPAGMQILYAIVTAPDELRQDASVPHDTVLLDPGIYEFRISREFNPFAEEVKRVAD